MVDDKTQDEVDMDELTELESDVKDDDDESDIEDSDTESDDEPDSEVTEI